MEFAARDIPFAREVLLVVEYKHVPLACHYRADFVCFGEVLVELKALDRLSGNEEAQVINYLKATGRSVCLLLNFGTRSLEHKRLVLSGRKSAESAQSADK